MIDSGCQNSECTFDQTGLCALNDPPDECPNRLSVHKVEISGDVDATAVKPVLLPPEDTPRFPSSTVLGIDDVRALMRKEYCHVIGLLGEPDAGKTACLVSLYLLLSNNRLTGFTYADSKSLQALDELSRGSRIWQGSIPEQMTVHTEYKEGRTAGFMHIKLIRKCDGIRLNLFFPDLPGEWTSSLIDSNRVDRLLFLRATDAIWIMVNGQTLLDKSQRLGAVHRTKILIDRIASLFSPDIPAMHLVVSRSDEGNPEEETLQEIKEHGINRNIRLLINPIASFSNSKEIVAGTGITDLIGQTVASPVSYNIFWPEASESGYGIRKYLKFGAGRIQ